MHCPVCHKELKPVEANGATVDVCEEGCGGIWFDQFELRRFDHPNASPPNVLLSVQQKNALLIESNRKRPCPRCDGVMLKRRLFSPKSRVEIDECGGCAGIWLDAGELAKIREEMREISNHKPPINTSILTYLAERDRV